MQLRNLEINGFKSFAHKTNLEFKSPVVCIVGPNGSGKSNVVEAFRYVLGEQSMKSMRGKAGLDLIFKGSKTLSKSSRAAVTIYFNNEDKVFKLSNDEGENVNLNYDIISVSREVYPDGLNKYSLNGTEVRLKDVNNLLSSVHIGSSGHHIISQGEADRILNASPKDLREMVEDALGLKIYQYKIKESERKLERANNNIKEVSMLRRENAPHLNFLRKQMEKLEKTKEMQGELAVLYREYLKKESVYLEEEGKILSGEKHKILNELREVVSKIDDGSDERSQTESAKIEELKRVERKTNEVRAIKNEMGRKLGRIEGMIEMEEYRKEKEPEVVVISQAEVKSIISEIDNSINEAIAKEDVAEIKSILERIKSILKKFDTSKDNKTEDQNFKIEDLKRSQREVVAEVEKIEAEEAKMAHEVESLKQEISKEMESLRDKERAKFAWKVRQQELSSALELLNIKEGNVAKGKDALENELREGVALIGREILSFQEFQIEGPIDLNLQEELRRKIERIKIKLEDAGTSNSAEISREFKEVSDRDQFLAKEMEDLTLSIASLENLIKDLQEKIDIEFKEGVKKINKEFGEFFALMFNGGTGTLSVVVQNKKRRRDELDEEGGGEEEIIFEEGVEINVSLPHKKVKELHALSGGERSLTSIALLFAMSQVNPPPFLILDETDAALDEANSRKFGDMIEKLSHHSQLIVVTHNRETMSRAGMLYGVTVGSDGASKLLSIKFEEATAIAK